MTAHESYRAACVKAWQAFLQADKEWTMAIAKTRWNENWTSNEGQPGTPLRAAYDAWVKAGDAWRELLCEGGKP